MSDAEITSNKIREQVEFYFSDSNLPKDKFLRSLVANNPEGYVELKTIASFNRMKQISTDMDLIVSALKKSSMLEIDAEGKLVRRITALPEVDTSNARTLYAKGFPLDESVANLDSIKALFEPFGKVVCVRARREKNGTFKGSAFIEFDSESTVNELAGKSDFKFGESVLLLETKQQHFDRKRKEREESKQKKNQEKKQEDVSNMQTELKQNFFLHIQGIEGDEKFGFADFSKKLPYNKKNGLKFIDFPLDGDKTKAILRLESKEVFDSLKQQFDEGKIELPGKAVASEMAPEDLEKYIAKTCEAKFAESNKNKRKGFGGRGGKPHWNKKKKTKTE
ncbi:sjogren syndrome antigen B-like protein [Naegleria gruberi]|uniref:Sjogren syndrome antigen B-like protein n=1 Tax=Naegleria gruberi TaxID=5762 RepID=D2VVB8_NAEGR|nr:sjogren syndrome antigen B-like protein [Naegleria gruberi]EFC39281.1 sjogren syndrome antigen B-like protein [Naegleria gruberi]|eukprot:XP_002672025.1 sjogren syndrome antigen B-like protein [Naegleria gruberi strain NEG-M]